MNKEYGRVSAPAPDISTKSELERLQMQRAAPAPTLKPEPPRSVIGADLQKENESFREARIKLLQEKLSLQSTILLQDRKLAIIEGRSKAVFNTKARGQGRDE